MKVLVTGGTGFIGTHVVNKLLSLGHTPIIFDRQGRPNAKCEVILGDTRDFAGVVEAAAHVDGVIHLAGVLGTQETIQNPIPAAETNVIGGINMFRAIHQYELPAVYIAVGNHWMNNTYSITKTTAERFAFMFNQELGTRIAVVRALNAYGEGQVAVAPWGPSKVRKIMPSFVCKTLAGQPIEVYGDGTQVMDMIYVTDVADVLVSALLDDHGNYSSVMEAGSGRLTTVAHIAQTVINTVGKGEVVNLPMRPGEPPFSIVMGDPSTLLPLRSVDPKTFIPLEDGVSKAVEYFRPIVDRS